METLQQVLARSRAILFDMDGVLIDSEPVHEKAIVALTKEMGRELTDKALLFSFKGAPEKSMAEKLIALFPENTKSAHELIERKVDLYADLFQHVTLLEGARGFVEASHAAGRKHALVTSASRSTQELTFRTFGFAPYFEAIITGEDITKGKPDPEPYLIAAEKLGIPVEDCVVIEDSINGVKSGHAAGCKVVALLTTFPEKDLWDAGADFVVEGFGGFCSPHTIIAPFITNSGS